jgi:hypothetical protein
LGDFSAAVSDWVTKSDRVLEAVVKDAIQSTYNDMTKPRSKGGNMPVDTGFLRNSVEASQGAMPKALEKRTPGLPVPVPDVIGFIIDMRVGQPLYIGFTMNYGPAMENRYSFVALAAANWQANVTSAARKARK